MRDYNKVIESKKNKSRRYSFTKIVEEYLEYAETLFKSAQDIKVVEMITKKKKNDKEY